MTETAPAKTRKPRTRVGLTTAERLAVLESRMDNSDDAVRRLEQKMDSGFSTINLMLLELKNKRNPVTDFVATNWKYLVLAGAVLLGRDIHDLVQVFPLR